MTTTASTNCQSTTEQVLDLPQLLERCMGQLEFAEKLLTRFQQRLKADVEQLQQFVNAGNTVEAAGLAHQIRGSAATMAASALATKAAILETAARRDSVDDAEMSSATSGLMDEVDRFIAVVPNFSQLG